MKRLFFIYSLILSVLAVNADEISAELISKVKTKINSATSYRVSFTSEGINGTLIVSGVKFALISPEAEVYYDGLTMWNYSRKKKEVNVENVDPADPNVMINPSKLMTVNEKDFSHKSLTANSFELIPKRQAAIYSRIVITVNMSTNLPEKIEITDRETGDQTLIKVSGYTPNVPVTMDNFRFDVKKHKDIDVVDFR